MIGLPSLRVRCVLVAAPLVAVLGLCGCDNTFEYARYPPDLHYPVRTDLLVEKKPDQTPFAPPGPGHLDEHVAQIPSLGGEVIDPNKVLAAPGLEEGLRDALKDLFGTPRAPQVGHKDGEAKEVVDQLVALKLRDADPKNPFATLAKGSDLYRYHCLHCHGLTGDGRGPTGPWIDPHPRDYRRGLFKFISTAIYTNPEEPDPQKREEVTGRKPRREDLLRTLRTGIEGTSMPSFALMPDDQMTALASPDDKLNALASYVMHLSIRGEVEYELIKLAASGTITKKDDFAGKARAELFGGDPEITPIFQEWVDSNTLPPATPAKDDFKDLVTKEGQESIRRGYVLFSDPNGQASCIGCHLDYGRQPPFRYDAWGTLVRPMNLTTGVYRGGRRPIDIYWRIKGGIDPSGMPKTGLTTDKDIWDVVHFVQALPYPQMLPTDAEHPEKDVRYKIYDRPPAERPKGERAEK